MKISKSYLYLVAIIFISVFSCAEKPKSESFSDTLITEWNSSDSTDIPNQEKFFPSVMIKPNKGDSSQPLGINDLKIDVKITGNISTTTFEMTFYNDLDRILEGELYFPLGEGKTVSRFAMDFDGKLREGVIVEKAKGRAVFETIVRGKVDPGLLEWTKGNNFKARVYPIPAKGFKKIVIAYEQNLIHTPTESIYILPLGFKQKIKEFDLKIEILKQETKPQLNNNELTNLKFEKWKENYTFRLYRQQS